MGIGSQSACKGDNFLGGSIYSNTAKYYGWIQVRLGKWKECLPLCSAPSDPCLPACR